MTVEIKKKNVVSFYYQIDTNEMNELLDETDTVQPYNNGYVGMNKFYLF